MKPSIILTTIALVISVSILAENIIDNSLGLPLKPYTASFRFQTGEPVNISKEDFALVADSGSLRHELTISVTTTI